MLNGLCKALPPKTPVSQGVWFSNFPAVWLPWIQSKSQDPFTLLDLCQSNDQAIRRIGVKAMAAKTTWEGNAILIVDNSDVRIIIIVVISIAPYLTDKGKHTALYKISKDIYIKASKMIIL